MTEIDKSTWPSCPIPKSEYLNITMAHGGGGKMMHHLINKIFKHAFKDIGLQADHDGAVLNINENKLAFTTDSYVVNPLFFNGGDIGELAVYGTVNDLAMCGAIPQYISAGFIIEEGLPVETLWRVAVSMSRAAQKAHVKIVTGDTKVVDRGKGDGIFINTAGIGIIDHDLLIKPESIRPGDSIILSGDIGRHGLAIMARRQGLEFESEIESDCAPLVEPVQQLINAGIEIHCLRDLTRGGLASGLIELAESSGLKFKIVENDIQVREDIRGACEILGFDPIYVANEGRFVALMPSSQAEKALTVLQKCDVSKGSRIIGQVMESNSGLVTMKTNLGVERIIDMLSGEQLPRIC